MPAGQGLIGITLCPGKIDPYAMSGAWKRDLGADLKAIVAWKAAAIVCLVEPFELELLKVEDLPKQVKSAGLSWFHLPIRDVSVPDTLFECRWLTEGFELRQLLAGGRRIIIHCRGGLGRAGTIAAKLLVELGMDAEAAIALVRLKRPGAIEMEDQEAYVRKGSAPGAGQRRRCR